MKRSRTTRGKSARTRRPAKAAARKPRAAATTKAGPADFAIASLRSELEQKTRELNEALEQQAAAADVLKAISGATDLAAVLSMLVQSAAKLCRADRAAIRLLREGALHHLASYGFSAQQRDFMSKTPVPAEPGPGSIAGRVLMKGGIVQVDDVKADAAFKMTAQPGFADVRTVLGVPLMRGAALIGLFIFSRKTVERFTDKQIALVSTFADQAVIAIENARLLGELRQRTTDLTESLEQQTATSEVLSVISSSPGDLQPVFQTMLENATRICGAKLGILFLTEGDAFRYVAMYGAPPKFAEARQGVVTRVWPGTTLGRVAATKQPAQTADIRAEPAYTSDPERFAVLELAGARTILGVPMLKDGALVGIITVYRQEVLPFTDKQIELVQNFAAQAVIAIENARLLNELRQSLEQQTATSDVLRVISSSPSELKPVFDKILENATRICDAKCGIVQLHENGKFRNVAMCNPPSALVAYRQREPVIQAGPQSAIGRVAATKQVLHITDYAADTAYKERDPAAVNMVERAGARTVLLVPMLKEGEHVGNLNIYRQEVRPFTEKQIGLVQNFAAQAVIAIENARLLNELRQRTDDLTESLEQQTATAEVLKVISSSPGDLQPVFDAMLENAVRICEAKFGALPLWDGDGLRMGALHNFPPAFAEQFRRGTFRPDPSLPIGRLVHTRQVVHVADITEEPSYKARDPLIVGGVELGGFRTLLAVPMLKGDRLAGAIIIFRQEVRPFDDKQIALLQNFAAQAVIAVENARLLNELRQRTDDLTESLQQQTATSDILEVISNSPTDSQPAFEAIVRSGLNLFPDAVVVISLPDGDSVKLAAIAGADAHDREALRARYPMPLSREYITATAMLDAREMDFADARDTPAQLIPGGRNFLASGYRAITVVPMLRGDAAIGAITVARRLPGALSDKQRELLRTFASQAVIAIENTRLFNELRQRTDDLTEALEQQTATSEVLRVISSSPGELAPVFNTMLENATRLCGAKFGVLFVAEGEAAFRMVAGHGVPPAFVEARRREPVLAANPDTVMGRVAATKRPFQLPDVQAEPAYAKDPARAAFVKLTGARTVLNVPMLKDGAILGQIAIYRQEVRPYGDKEIALLTNFAAQAVIAIENTRLLNELRESLEQQTATADVLRVISASPGELQSVFQAMLKNATQICQAKFGGLWLRENQDFRIVATHGLPPEYREKMLNAVVRPGPTLPIARAASTRLPIPIADLREDQSYLAGEPVAVNGVEVGQVRTLVVVPMLKDQEVVGAFAIFRQEVRPFTDKQIELLKNFAAQAVIAIENTRLLNELRQRTDDLSKSLEDLRAAQDRLVQTEKLASLGQLTAGIAHEIKNPLNFVNNFSSLSVELIDELQQELAKVKMADDARAGIADLVDTLKANLDKIAQHGKRADAIVKNMLLHSREGSGERRPVDVNALVEESLNLAYHGARAEKKGFNITLERSFDATAGEVDLYPQEVTRVLLNIIANGFYAAHKRKAQADGAFEPMVTASTRNLGDRVEIRIRDNGTGIPPEVREKMFNPFFTTKPAGEGTGLGLSISHDIIVKQHSGTIAVDTELGQFTEFTIVLPRSAASLGKSAGTA